MYVHVKCLWYLLRSLPWLSVFVIIIFYRVFSDCHQIIPPKPFHQGCSFDSCHIVNTTMQCSGLEIYASLCASKGVCIDWRAKTNGSCRKYRSVNQCHSFSTNYAAMGALFIKYFACVSFIFVNRSILGNCSLMTKIQKDERTFSAFENLFSYTFTEALRGQVSVFRITGMCHHVHRKHI